MEWLGEKEIPFSIIFTKIDKLSKSKVNGDIEKYKAALSEVWEELPPLFISSAVTGEGKEEILNYIEAINQSID